MRISLSLDRSSSKDLSIMVDALRASTTIITALESFKTIVPVKEMRKAEIMANKYNATLAGERGGAKIDGFDTGNSPLDIKNFQGDCLVLTTTNGTRILKETSSSTVLVGSFVNAKAVASKAKEMAKNNIEVVMAGVNGEFAIEDFLSAGEIISYLQDEDLDEMALAALMASNNPVKVNEAVINSNSALGLKNLGLGNDVEFSLKRNIYNTVPIYKDGFIKKL